MCTYAYPWNTILVSASTMKILIITIPNCRVCSTELMGEHSSSSSSSLSRLLLNHLPPFPSLPLASYDDRTFHGFVIVGRSKSPWRFSSFSRFPSSHSLSAFVTAFIVAACGVISPWERGQGRWDRKRGQGEDRAENFREKMTDRISQRES